MVFILHSQPQLEFHGVSTYRSQRNRSRSVSSSTEALDSDHARYITSWIAQHARSMATGTRSLPTDSHVLYFQPIERGHVSEGGLSDIDSQRAVPQGVVQMSPHHVNLNETAYIPSGGTGCHPVVWESDRLSTYTGLDDYHTLFKARHGRGALDHMPRTSGEVITTSAIGMAPATFSVGVMENPMVEVRPFSDSGPPPTNQREHFPVSADPSMKGHEVVSPISSGHIRCCNIYRHDRNYVDHLRLTEGFIN